MPNFLQNLFKTGVKDVVDSVGKVLDNVITTKDELEAAKLKANEEINRHFEVLQNQADEMEKAYLADTQNARSRETEFVKATGHFDWMMWFLALTGVGVFMFMIYVLVNKVVPESNKDLISHGLGIIEGVVIAIFSYYFGSSAGSRIKDMKSKS